MIDNLTPEAERRQTLLALALTESDLSQLRQLPNDDARWRINHEYKVQIAWTARRRDFMLADCVVPKPPRKKKVPPPSKMPVLRHTSPGALGVVGERSGI